MSAATPGTAKQLMTADQFWEFVHRPENRDRDFELLRGEVIEMSRPTQQHGAVAALAAFELQLYARVARNGYVVTNDSGVELGANAESVLGPDVAYFTAATAFNDIHPKWGVVPPVLAVEVASPSDRPGRTNAKVREYLTGGVKLVWLIDYEERNVTVFRPNTALELVREGGELTGGDDLPGLCVKVADLFRVPAERPQSA
jgi:Uma2 family endonuclease